MKKLFLVCLITLSTVSLVKAQTFTVSNLTYPNAWYPADNLNGACDGDNTWVPADYWTTGAGAAYNGSIAHAAYEVNIGNYDRIEFSVSGTITIPASGRPVPLCSDAVTTLSGDDGTGNAQITIAGPGNWNSQVEISGDNWTVEFIDFVISNHPAVAAIGVDNAMINHVTATSGVTSNIHFQNATNSSIHNSELSASAAAGMLVETSTSISIEDVYTHDNDGFGISVSGGSTIVVKNCVIENNGLGENLTAADWRGTVGYNSCTTPLNPQSLDLPGLNIDGASDVLVDSNVVVANHGHGIVLVNCVSGTNLITRNVVGVEKDGLTPNGNIGEGIRLFNCSNVQIGGIGLGNQVCANGNRELFVTSLPSVGGNPGLFASQAAHTINMHGHGIEVRTSNSNITVIGNLVGTDPTGNGVIGTAGQALGNDLNGIYLVGASNVVVGGTASGEENIVGGNGFTFFDVHTQDSPTNGSGCISLGSSFTQVYTGVRHGIQLDDGPGAASNNLILGNHVGIGADGSTDIGNSEDGISILGFGSGTGATGNIVGGATADHGNLIGGSNFGIAFQGPYASANQVLFNFIGGDQSGNATVPVGNAGIKLQSGSNGNTIGSTTAGNVIVSNPKAMEVFGSGSNNNTIQGNTMVCNATGIDLYSDGNDLYASSGSVQFDYVSVNTVETRADYVSGFTPNIGDLIDIYVADTCTGTCQDPRSGQFAGHTWVAQVTATADVTYSSGAGFWEFDLNSAAATSAGLTKLNAIVTATNATGSTSEFNACTALTTCEAPTSVVIVAVDSTLCTGGSATISNTTILAPGFETDTYVYALYLTSDLINPVQTNGTGADFTVTVAGSYQVKVYNPDDEAGCGRFSNVTTIQIESPLTPQAITGVDEVCANTLGVAYGITGQAGSSFNWSIVSGNATFNGASTGTSVTLDFGAASTVVLEVEETSALPFGCTAPATSTISITVNDLPTGVVITPLDDVCENETVTYSVTSPAVGSTFDWTVTGATSSTPGGSSIDVTWGSTAGTISVEETDANTCIDPNPTVENINVNLLPTNTALAGPLEVCAEGTETYTVSGDAGSTFDWVVVGATPATFSGTSLDLTFGTTATATIEIIESTSATCVAASPLLQTITINPLPQLTGISIDPAGDICAGDTVTLTTDVLAGVDYDWIANPTTVISTGLIGSNVLNSIQFVASETGTVTVTATDQITGCVSDVNDLTPITVTVNAVPTAPNLVGPDTTNCGEIGVLYEVVDSTTGSIYTWTYPDEAIGDPLANVGGTDASAVVDFGTKRGQVTVFEETAAGCVGPLASQQVDLINCALQADFIVDDNTPCDGVSVTFTDNSTYNEPTANVTFTWDFGLGAVPATASGPGPHVVDYPGPGSYDVELIVSEFGGASVDTITTIGAVTVNANPNVDSAPLFGNFTVCEGFEDSVWVNDVVGSSFNWTHSSGTLLNTPDTMIVLRYADQDVNITIVETIDATGCTASRDTVVVVTPAPIVGTITGDTDVCEGETVSYSYDQTSGASYDWTVPTGAVIVGASDQSTIDVTWGTLSGDITVVETSVDGCFDQNNAGVLAVTVTPNPVIQVISGPDVVCAGDTATYFVNDNPGNVYDWSSTAHTIVSGDGTNSVEVILDASGPILLIESTNGCFDQPAVKNVTPVALPSSPAITPEALRFCDEDTGTFTANVVAGATYCWLIPTAASFVASQECGVDNNVIDVMFGATGGDVGVTITDANGCAAIDTATVTIAIDPLVGDINIIIDPTTGLICDRESVDSVYVFEVQADDATAFNWVVTPAGAAEISETLVGDVSTVEVKFESGQNPISISVAAENGCGTGNANVIDATVTESTTIAIDINDVTLCDGLSDTVFVSGTTGNETITWTVDGDVQTETGTQLILDEVEAGAEVIATASADANVCIADAGSILADTISIDALQQPEVEATISLIFNQDKLADRNDPEWTFTDTTNVIMDGDINNGEDGVMYNYAWSWYAPIADSTGIANINSGQTGVYNTIAQQEMTANVSFPRFEELTYYFTVSNGVCPDAVDSIIVFINFDKFIPTAFSPNNDDVYDTWVIKNIDQFPDATIRIYNRWGNIVYDPGQGVLDAWDGTRDGEALPMGTYFYTIDFGDGTNAAGDVTILK